MKRFKGKCPICGRSVIEDEGIPIGYVKQGAIGSYFHLSCLDKIKRGSDHGKTEEA